MTPTQPAAAVSLRRGWQVVGVLCLGYVGVYLARKNLSVAIPLLQAEHGNTREELGRIASAGTLAYALGKLCNGPLVDRLGGRTGFLLSLGGVALFGAAGALAPGLSWLVLAYAANRWFGSAGWGAMVKVVPTWFGAQRAGVVLGVLSLSYIAGGVLATLLAREVVARGGDSRAVLGVPSLVLVFILLACFAWVREGDQRPAPLGVAPEKDAGTVAARVRALLRRPAFLLACGMSFAITLMREVFNTWSVDWLRTLPDASGSVAAAALQSTLFDLAGGAAILLNGWLYDRLESRGRQVLMAGNLAGLAMLLAALPQVASPAMGTAAVALVGLLVYGPFSLLAGVIAVETGGARTAATAAGIIDGVGYLAGVLAGSALGYLLDVGGYGLGFRVLAGVTALAALMAALRRPEGFGTRRAG